MTNDPRPDGTNANRPNPVRTDGGEAVDAVTLEVLRNAYAAIAEEMNATLVRTGYSPNIKERRDCSCAVFDAAGGMVAQAETMPVHLGSMPFSVAAALERYPPETLSAGDALLLNDPFHGGAHLPDLTLVTPVFHGDDVLAIAANRAHHADVGGARAGSVAADSTEIYQEGIRIPPIKLYEGGEVDEDVLALLLANVRTPDERRGDLRAQHAANETARGRLHDLDDRYGPTVLSEAVAEIQNYSERRMRRAIVDLPDGTYEFTDVLDDDGHGTTDVTITAAVTINGDELVVDFDGSAAQTPSPINAVRAVTVSATYYAVRCLTEPDIPPNEGCYRPIEVCAPEGTVVNARPPAAVVGGNLEVSQRITDVVLGALAPVAPERAIAACQGTMNNVTIGGVDPRSERPYTFYETQAGGFGGRANDDGMDGVQVHMTNTMNTPVEVLETAYPLAIERYELRPDSGGAGEHRGGLGIRRDVRIRGHDAVVNLIGDRRTHAPYGIRGGDDGEPGADVVVRDGEPRRVPAKSTHELHDGDVVSVRTPGGGGYGDPGDRDLDAIRRDIQLGKVSPEEARRRYGFDVEEYE